MLPKRVKIAVAGEEWDVVLDAAGGDENVDCAARRDAFAAQVAIVSSGLDGDFGV
jgi:hypothetical protein